MGRGTRASVGPPMLHFMAVTTAQYFRTRNTEPVCYTKGGASLVSGETTAEPQVPEGLHEFQHTIGLEIVLARQFHQKSVELGRLVAKSPSTRNRLDIAN